VAGGGGPGQGTRADPSAVLMAAFAEVLGRWSGRSDLTLNVTLFDRADVHPDVTWVMGDFTSLLLVPCGRGTNWLERARFTHERLWQAIDHRDVSAVQVMRGLRDTMPVVFTSALGVGADRSGGLFDEPVWGTSQTPQVWLDHQVTESGGGVRLIWDAVEELFPAGLLDDMFAAYLSLVDGLAEQDWAALPDLLPRAQREVRERVNATAGELPDRTLHADFFRNAAENPDRVALVWDGGTLSYGELADRARRVAAGVLPGTGPVAVSLPKGPDQIAAVLGVLAAGRAYVPVGVDQPPARRERMLRDIPQVITSLDLSAKPADVVHAHPHSLAYVIFTSGSTGEPKGVEITHRAALNTIADINERFEVTEHDRVLAVSALDFDLSVYDVFGLLAAGGSIVTIAEDDRRDAERWHSLVISRGVTVWNTVPALAEMLSVVGETPSLRLVLVSGDWVGLDLPQRFPHARFVAMGGATEASIWSNFVEVAEPEPHWRSIPYGPLHNQRFRVVDDQGRDCPDHVQGELWIGGAGVARGYRGRCRQDTGEVRRRLVPHRGLRPLLAGRHPGVPRQGGPAGQDPRPPGRTGRGRGRFAGVAGSPAGCGGGPERRARRRCHRVRSGLRCARQTLATAHDLGSRRAARRNPVEHQR
jgi:yersiniabactin nonribosomal peptide synthetase